MKLTTKQRKALWITFFFLNALFIILIFSMKVDQDPENIFRIILKKETGIWAIFFCEAALYGMSFLAAKIFDNER